MFPSFSPRGEENIHASGSVVHPPRNSSIPHLHRRCLQQI
jgi:hypothetical protein